MSRKAGHGKQSESEQSESYLLPVGTVLHGVLTIGCPSFLFILSCIRFARSTVMGQVWHGLVDTLRLLPTVPSKSSTSESIASETQTIDDALDKIALLISLRRGESVGPDKMASTGTSLHPHIPAGTGTGAGAAPSTPSASSTAGANGAAGGNKRKRRQSISISPAPPASIPSPTFAGVGIHSRIDRSSTPQINNNGPKGKKDVDQYLDYDHRQLPLQSGRKVAFKQPPAEGQREEDCEWILATVLRCLLGDKTRYTVKDDDDGK